MLTIFANLKIETPVKVQHLKDSFLSFNTISDNWLINIRGEQREVALDFLRQELGEKMIEFSLLDDSRGWSNNALDMLKMAKYDYVLIWNEDHINLAPQNIYQKIIEEMSSVKADYLGISFFSNNQFLKPIAFEPLNYIDFVLMTRANWAKVFNGNLEGYKPFILSLSGIYHKNLFKKLLLEDQINFYTKFRKNIRQKLLKAVDFLSLKKLLKGYYKTIAITVANSANLYAVPDFSFETPFNLERNQYRTELLPLHYAIPKQELFACIDDDNAVSGSSLISRGLYDQDLDTKNNQVDKNMIQEKITAILKELNQVLSKVDEDQVKIFIETILKAKNIVVVGAGRVGLASRSFAQRLGHLGLSAYMLGDATVPGIGAGDLLIVASGSGETQTIFDLVSIAKNNQATIALVTGNKESRMGQLADVIVEIKAPSKTKQVEGLISIQPMTTLNEQSLWLFFDAVVLCLMEKINETHDTMWQRHSNLE